MGEFARAGSSGRSIVINDGGDEARFDMNADDTAAFIRKANTAHQAAVEAQKERDALRAERYAREHEGVWGSQTAGNEIAAAIRGQK